VQENETRTNKAWSSCAAIKCTKHKTNHGLITHGWDGTLTSKKTTQLTLIADCGLFSQLLT